MEEIILSAGFKKNPTARIIINKKIAINQYDNFTEKINFLSYIFLLYLPTSW